MKKYIQLLAALLLPLSFVACDDDNNTNSGNATVGFGQAELTVKENITSLNVPIQLEGTHDGLVTVNVAVKDINGASLVDDETIMVTSKKLFMPADVNTVNVEILTDFYTSGDDLNRSFTLEITSVEGANIGQQTCKVNLEEAVDAYDKLVGTWTLPISQGQTLSIAVKANADKSGYDCSTSLQGVSFTFHMTYSPTKVEVVSNEYIVSGLDFGGEVGVVDVMLMLLDVNTNTIYQQNIPGTWNDAFDKITFQAHICAALMRNGQFARYSWFDTADSGTAVMTKVK